MTNYGELSYLIDTITADTTIAYDLDCPQGKQPQQINLSETRQITNNKFIDKIFSFFELWTRSPDLR